jgi:hypothetical protein
MNFPFSWVLIVLLALGNLGVYGAMRVHEEVVLDGQREAAKTEREAAVKAAQIEERAACTAQRQKDADEVAARIQSDTATAWTAEQAIAPTPKDQGEIDKLCCHDRLCRQNKQACNLKVKP